MSKWMRRCEVTRIENLARKAILYVRRSSAYQVSHNLESQRLLAAVVVGRSLDEENLQRLAFS